MLEHLLKERLGLKYMILYNQSCLRILKNSFDYIAATADETITVKTVKVTLNEYRRDSEVRETEKWRLYTQCTIKAAAATGLWAVWIILNYSLHDFSKIDS